MPAKMNLAVTSLLASSCAFAAAFEDQPHEHQQTRKLQSEYASTNCSEGLHECYLLNKSTNEVSRLRGNDSYCPSDSRDGWTIRCDPILSMWSVSPGVTDRYMVDSMKFSYNRIVHVESVEPYFMAGDVNDVTYLSSSGSKRFTVEGLLGGETCFSNSFQLNASCDDRAEISLSQAGCAILPEDKYYEIINDNSDLGLQVSRHSTTRGSGVIQWPNAEAWRFQPASDGYFNIIGRNSGLGLNVNGRSTANGQGIIIWSITNHDSDQWCLVPYTDGTYGVVNRNSGKSLNVKNRSHTNAAQIVQATPREIRSRSWYLREV